MPPSNSSRVSIANIIVLYDVVNILYVSYYVCYGSLLSDIFHDRSGFLMGFIKSIITTQHRELVLLRISKLYYLVI